MKRKLKRLICSVVLAAMLLSSVAAAAPAPLASCNHIWTAKIISTVDVVVERNHQCTICGARIELYKAAPIYGYQCVQCDAWRGDTSQGNTYGPTYAIHPCYN